MITYAADAAAQRLGEIGVEDRTLFSALRHLTRRLDVEQTCTAALEAVESLFEATSSWVLLHDQTARQLKVCVFRGPGADCYVHLDVPEDGGIVGQRVFLSREPVFVPDVAAEDSWFDPSRMRQSGLRSVFMVPLTFEQRAVGVIALDSPRFTNEHPPLPADVARLEAVGAMVAIAIENARLYQSSERDRRRMREALEQRRQLRQQVFALQREATAMDGRPTLVGSSAVLQRVLQEVDVISRADATVLLLGETGTGKELVARAIHEGSRRRSAAFVAVNCAAMPESLIESELFGHERGAFTGAVHAKPGKFELAHRGTLFLDEVGDLPLEAQAKLLRVLQDREVQRVGGTRSTRVDVRIIAATNVDLDEGLAEGSFRADLFYRLNVFPIRLPPLRERRGDIPLLASYFLAKCAEASRNPAEAFSPEALERLQSYDWPGNVRELQNVIERAVMLASGSVIDASVIGELRAPGTRQSARVASDAAGDPAGVESSSPRTLEEADREVILRALRATGWRISGRSGAAELLGLKPTTLHAKMKKLGIRRPRVPPG